MKILCLLFHDWETVDFITKNTICQKVFNDGFYYSGHIENRVCVRCGKVEDNTKKLEKELTAMRDRKELAKKIYNENRGKI